MTLSSPDVARGVDDRANELLREHRATIHRRTDKLFAILMVVQWVAAIAAAIWISPRTWDGPESRTHLHVWAASGLGGLITVVPVALALRSPGTTLTRHVIAVAQALWSGLLIHVSGGRIETHFHVFGSLAFLAFYRDWRVLVPATAVITLDHLIRGVFWPQSVFGVITTSQWRWLEHAAWVIFEDIFLIRSCIQGAQEMKQTARRQAELEATNSFVEATIDQRTSELSHLKRKVERILHSVGEGILVIDLDGRVTFANPAAYSLLGWTGADCVDESIHPLLFGGGPEELSHGIRMVLQTGQSQTTEESEFERKNGETFPVNYHTDPLREEGELVGAVLTFRDVSEHAALQNQLLHAQKLESIGQLAAGIAHEINTPTQYVGDNTRFLQDAFRDLLEPIDACRQLASNGGDPAETEARLERVRDSFQKADMDYLVEEIPRAIHQSLEGVGRVSSIVKAMKEFSHPTMEMTAVDLNQAIESTVTVARNEWKYVAEVDLDLDRSLPAVPCLPGEINQVVLNMIVNAAHAIAEVVGESQEKGTIRIRTRLHGEWAEVQISDTGSGMPEEVRARVFDPFFTTKRVGQGTGQGLSIAHAVIVKKHGGVVSVESESGRGTTFRFLLPLVAQKAPAEEAHA